MVNPPLIIVSALFFLAMVSVFYLGAWIAATLILRIGGRLITNAGAKRVLMTALLLPPVLAAIPTLSGATLRHSHASEAVEHHSMMCQQMFSQLPAPANLANNGAAGIVVNMVAWLLLIIGGVFIVRLLLATMRLETGMRPFLAEPSPKLNQALTRCGARVPNLNRERFHECSIPAAYSSVLGFWRVRCMLSKQFIADASNDELDAVIAHEAAHLRFGDVRATLLVGMLNCFFFYLRPVRLLSRRWREAAELTSDDSAVVSTQKPLALASAILRASGVPARALPATALAFADEAACSSSKRVERLIAQAEHAALPHATDQPLQAAAMWTVTVLLAGLGVVILAAPATVCYAHCSLEAVARLLL